MLTWFSHGNDLPWRPSYLCLARKVQNYKWFFTPLDWITMDIHSKFWKEAVDGEPNWSYIVPHSLPFEIIAWSAWEATRVNRNKINNLNLSIRKRFRRQTQNSRMGDAITNWLKNEALRFLWNCVYFTRSVWEQQSNVKINSFLPGGSRGQKQNLN